jgi:AAA+ ATPase superfamily predicted ATPase
MLKKRFIGRSKELEKLSQLANGAIARLIVLKGRRRIGKSRLLLEFARNFNNYYIFSGLPPGDGVTAKEQKLEFTKQLFRQFAVQGINTDDWSDLFWHLGNNVQSGKVLIIFDEITWMAQGDPTFLPKLKNAWDLQFKNNPNLILAICGSVSAWIEENILQSTGFLGRISLNMTLDELPLPDCLKFWGADNYISNQDKLIMLSITGGVPRYLEEINYQQTALDNIARLCFAPDGILFSEFDHIFSDLFAKKNQLYKNLINNLVANSYEIKDLVKLLGLAQNGDIYKCFDDLITAGFISRDYNWDFKNGKNSKLSKYRLTDNYCRFYLKYILPNKDKIARNSVSINQFSALAGFYTIVGLQFENIVLKNRRIVWDALNLEPSSIVNDNPYFQRKTTKQDGCQIDYLIQTKHNTLLVCEIKFSTGIITADVITQVKDKISKLKRPKNFSCVPVLIHFGDLSPVIEDSGFFVKIINFADYMVAI